MTQLNEDNALIDTFRAPERGRHQAGPISHAHISFGLKKGVGVGEGVINKLACSPHRGENGFTTNLVIAILEISLKDTKSGFSVKHGLYSKGSDRDAPLGINAILHWANDRV